MFKIAFLRLYRRNTFNILSCKRLQCCRVKVCEVFFFVLLVGAVTFFVPYIVDTGKDNGTVSAFIVGVSRFVVCLHSVSSVSSVTLQ